MPSLTTRAVQAFRAFRTPIQASHTEGVPSQLDPLVPPSLFTEAGEGNPFTSYETVVQEIVKKYNNDSKFGCSIVKHVLDWRASVIAGNGLNVQADDEATQEWLQEFIEYNSLDSYGLFELVLEGETEGKALLHLIKEPDDEQICVRHLAWLQHKYIVKTDDEDYEEITAIEFPNGPVVTISGTELENYIYLKLGGSKRFINLTPPRIANVLYHIENLDKALADLRKNNHLFGAVTPFLELPTEAEAKVARTKLFGRAKEFIWNIGKMLIMPGKLTFVEPSGNAVTVLTKEVETLAKIISASTGIPVHFLGYVDLMSNRATAQELMEMVNATTLHEREIWKGKMKQLCIRAVEMYNEMTGSALSIDGIDVSIPVVTMSQIDLVSNVYGNLYNLGAISMQTLRQMIPGINPEEEAELIAKEKAERAKEFALIPRPEDASEKSESVMPTDDPMMPMRNKMEAKQNESNNPMRQ